MSGMAGNAMTTKCCYCGMVKNQGRWHHPVEEASHLVSHGCCPACERALMDDLDYAPEGDARVAAASGAFVLSPPRPRRGLRAAPAEAAV